MPLRVYVLWECYECSEPCFMGIYHDREGADRAGREAVANGSIAYYKVEEEEVLS